MAWLASGAALIGECRLIDALWAYTLGLLEIVLGFRLSLSGPACSYSAGRCLVREFLDQFLLVPRQLVVGRS